MEQEHYIFNSIRGRLNEKEGTSYFQELQSDFDENVIDNIIITGTGSSWNVCLIGKYMIEEYTRIRVKPVYASELRYRPLLNQPNTLFIAISKSGETIDTLYALKNAKKNGLRSISIVCAEKSSIEKISDKTLKTNHSSKSEIDTSKSFISQVIVLALFTLHLGRYRTLSLIEGLEVIGNIYSLPSLIQEILKQSELIKEISRNLIYTRNICILGNKYNYPIAKEASVIFSETCYIHTSTVYSSELKHGPITLVDRNMPVIVILSENELFEKTLSNIQELKARKAHVIVITDAQDDHYMKFVDYTIRIPKVAELLSPILSLIPIQQIANNIAIENGIVQITDL